MKRCLAIAGVFPPYGGAGAVRQVKLFNHLRAHGWQVDVIAPRGRAGWYRDAELDGEVADLRVTRIGLPVAHPGLERLRAVAKEPHRRSGMLDRAMAVARSVRDVVAVPDEKAAWAVMALAYARARISRERYHAVFTSGPPYSCHLVGLGLRTSGGPPWLAEHRDPWAGHWIRAHGTTWRRAVDGGLESMVMRHADAVNVISPAMARVARERYGAELAAKLHVITNGFDPADFDGSAARRSSRDGLELLYVGTLDAHLTSLEGLLAGVARLDGIARSRVRLRVVGGADLEVSRRLNAWMMRHGDGRMSIDGFTSHRSATREMAGADVLVLYLAPGASWVLTSKVFEYLASDRPILAVVPPGDCRDLLERCGGAVIVDPGDSDGVARHLIEALGSGELSVRPRNWDAIAEYAYPQVAGRVARVLSEISGAP